MRKGLNAPDAALIYSAKKRAPETEVRPLEVKNTIEKDELVVKSEQEMLASIISPKSRALTVVEVVKNDEKLPEPAPKTDDAEIDFQLKPDTQALIEPRKQDVVLDAPAPEPEPVKERVALVEPVKPELLQPLVAAPVAAQKPVLKLVVPPKQREKPAFTLKAPEPAKPALVLKMPETQKPAFTLKAPVAEEAFKQEIGTVLFNGSSAALPASAKAVVNEAVQAWNDNSIAVLQVRHAGGSLAERRARAVADALKRAGAEQVETVAAEMPLSSAVEVCLVY